MIDPVLVDSGCDENLVCGVCTLVLRVPMSGCPQGHTFCERCYRTHLVERPTCPTCRHPVAPDGLVRNRPIENMVLTLRVACSHSDPSVYLTPCGWKGTLGELDAHLGSSCPNEPVSCPHAGCVVRLPRRLLAAHARDECTRRPVPCQHCGLDVAKSELAAHEAGRTAVGSALMAVSQAASPAACVVRPRAWAHPRTPGRLSRPGRPSGHAHLRCCFQPAPASHFCAFQRAGCGHAPTVCANGCGAALLKNQVAAHDMTCPLAPSPCPCLGCGTIVPRRDLNEHLTTFAVEHARAVALA